MPSIIRIQTIGLEEGDAVAYFQTPVVIQPPVFIAPEPPPQPAIPPSPFITPTLTLS